MGTRGGAAGWLALALSAAFLVLWTSARAIGADPKTVGALILLQIWFSGLYFGIRRRARKEEQRRRR